MLIIPLVPGKNQTLSVVLANQLCRIDVYGNSEGVFLDLYIDNTIVRSSVLCLNQVQMITEEYLGFDGRLMFQDTQGSSDPEISGIGDRYQLRYLESGIDF